MKYNNTCHVFIFKLTILIIYFLLLFNHFNTVFITFSYFKHLSTVIELFILLVCF